MDIYTKRFLELEQDLEAIGKTKIRKHLEYFGDNDFIDQEMLDTVGDSSHTRLSCTLLIP